MCLSLSQITPREISCPKTSAGIWEDSFDNCIHVVYEIRGDKHYMHLNKVYRNIFKKIRHVLAN